MWQDPSAPNLKFQSNSLEQRRRQPLRHWLGNHTIKGHNYPISINQCFLNTIYDTGSDQIVRFLTRGANILDVFLTNRPFLIKKCKAVPGVSDHDIVFVEASTRATITKQPQRKIFLWKHVDIEEKKPGVLDFFHKIHCTVFRFHWFKRTVGYIGGLYSPLSWRRGPQQDDIITL